MRLMPALVATLLCCGSAMAQDAALQRQLDALGHEYEVDADGDFRLLFATGDERTQLVFVISSIETYGSHRVREVWAPAYRMEDDDYAPAIANRLLKESGENKLGGWIRQDDLAVYVVKIPADASDQELDDAMEFAANVADRMEDELTDGEDEF